MNLGPSVALAPSAASSASARAYRAYVGAAARTFLSCSSSVFNTICTSSLTLSFNLSGSLRSKILSLSSATVSGSGERVGLRGVGGVLFRAVCAPALVCSSLASHAALAAASSCSW